MSSEIPQIGLGTYLATGDDVYEAVKYALSIGYRHIDTAHVYGNHQEIARAIKDSGIERKDLFITSKVAFSDHGFESTTEAIDRMIEELDCDYMDLVLLHFPGIMSTDEEEIPVLQKGEKMYFVKGSIMENIQIRIHSWRAMENAKINGKTRYIGVSNYMVTHLEEMLNYARMMPVVNQVEIHPLLPRIDLLIFCATHQIKIEAYGSIVQGGMPDLLTDPTVVEIAKELKKTPAQVLLRWAIQLDMIVLPKSVKPSRIEENTKIFDFSLKEKHMALLGKLDCDREDRPTDSAACRDPPASGAPDGKIGTYYWDPLKVPFVEWMTDVGGQGVDMEPDYEKQLEQWETFEHHLNVLRGKAEL